MLIPRIITAAVLIAIFVILGLLPNPIYFGLFMALLAALCAWEMLRLMMYQRDRFVVRTVAPVLLGVVVFAILAVYASCPMFAHWIHPALLYMNIALVICWLFIMPFLLWQRERFLSCLWTRILIKVILLASIFSTWYIVYSSLHKGFIYLLTWLAIVWCADTGAYFGGRYFGGAKLAPQISPGKTVSGAIAGVATATLWTCLSVAILASFTHPIYLQGSWYSVVVVGIMVALVSIVGDLFESMIKRQVGVKDSSCLLPGHGGVWDRLDSVLAIAPLISVLAYLTVGL